MAEWIKGLSKTGKITYKCPHCNAVLFRVRKCCPYCKIQMEDSEMEDSGS